MQVSCPHCQTSIDIFDDEVPDSLNCHGCGQQFERVIEDTILVDTGKIGGDVTFVARQLPSETVTPIASIGDYEIIEELARGGMGVVYKARQVSLGRTVALKMILGGQFVGEDQVKRFLTEARAAAKLDHAGIVPVFEVGQHDGQHFLSMAFVEGTTLLGRLAEGPLSPDDAARLMLTVAEAVQFAHDHGVVHRDLKPHNILLDGGTQPRITDFGLARNVAEESGVTATGQIMGTPSYMPPEQAMGMGSEVGPLADVYSLGATLYHLLTGRPPFQAASSLETVRLVVDQEPAPPRTLNSRIPRDLETICLKCLRKEPAKRYATAGELAEDLRRWLGGEPIKARPVGRLEKIWLWCKRRPAAATFIAVVILLLAAARVGYSRTQALASVENLLVAEPQSVLAAADRAAAYRYWTESRLKQVVEAEAELPADIRRQLQARLALVQLDPDQASPLMEQLLELPLDQLPYLGVIREALIPHRDIVIGELWSRLHDSAESEEVRLRAGLALAGMAPNDAQWLPADYQFLTEQLVSKDGVFQPDLWQLLDDVGEHLLEPLETVFSDRTRPDDELVAAAYGLGHFGPEDSVRLAQLLSRATSAQYKALYPKYEALADSASESALASVANEELPADADFAERVAGGKRRAAAAVTMLRQGQRDTVYGVLRWQEDPEALTQFVGGCRGRGVTPTQLMESLREIDERRGPLGEERRKVDDSVMIGLLLALGEFEVDELPAEREPLIESLEKIYALDPSSGVHSACGWLMRRWGFTDAVVGVDQTPLAFDQSGHREWYVTEIETSGSDESTTTLYFTFIVFPPAESTLGSPEDEFDHVPNEDIRRVKLTQTVAVSAYELTWRDWMAMEGTGRRDAYSQQFSQKIQPQDPVLGIDWYSTVKYCRWLTEQAELPEAEQCYAVPADVPTDENGRPTDWPLLDPTRAGFRLLSEAEWEHACRSGTRTAYSFGNDRLQIDRYGWYQVNAHDWVRSVGLLRPNPRGLFDMHGNVSEWCHDLYAPGALEEETDPFGPETGSLRMVRGGSWTNRKEGCRSADRSELAPRNRLPDIGIRLAVVPSRQPAADDETSSSSEPEETAEP